MVAEINFEPSVGVLLARYNISSCESEKPPTNWCELTASLIPACVTAQAGMSVHHSRNVIMASKGLSMPAAKCLISLASDRLVWIAESPCVEFCFRLDPVQLILLETDTAAKNLRLFRCFLHPWKDISSQESCSS